MLTGLALKIVLIELVVIVPVMIPQVLIALLLLALVQIFARVAQKLAPAKKNSRDISPYLPLFASLVLHSINVLGDVLVLISFL